MGGDGLAVLGDIWDCEDGTLQGFSGVDLSDMPAWFRHVNADSGAVHETFAYTMEDNGSVTCATADPTDFVIESINGVPEYEQLGHAASTASDVDGDGSSDLIVDARW